jgi:serine/threonine-protein kinase RsbT
MATTEQALRLRLLSLADIVEARQRCRRLALEAGFSNHTTTLVATAVSEIARNVLEHAGTGELTMSLVNDNAKAGIEIVAADEGPGIADVSAVLGDPGVEGEWKSFGIGLPGARSLMDEFEIVSTLGQGTTVIMKKWMAPS